MRRTPALFALLAISLVAGAWLFTPAPQREDTPAAACDGAETCTTMVEESPAPEPEGAARSRTAPQAPPAASDPAQLREEADRLIAEGKVEEGLDRLRKATTGDPSLRNHADLGALLYKLTAFEEAARHLRAAAELDPANPDRWIALANTYYRRVDLGEAWKAEKRAREAEPGLVLGRDSEGMRVRK